MLLFGAFNATLFAGKVGATVTAGQWVIDATMSEPSIGQVLVCAGTVVTLVGANLYALVSQGRAKEHRRQAVLAIIKGPRTDPAVREKLLAQLED